MNPHRTITAALAFAEHDILHQAGQLHDLAELLVECGPVVPACYFAARRVRRLRRRLLTMLSELDESITEAIRIEKERNDG